MLTFTDESEHPGGGKAKTSDKSEEVSAMCSRYSTESERDLRTSPPYLFRATFYTCAQHDYYLLVSFVISFFIFATLSMYIITLYATTCTANPL
jgi:hypothetical protein